MRIWDPERPETEVLASKNGRLCPPLLPAKRSYTVRKPYAGPALSASAPSNSTTRIRQGRIYSHLHLIVCIPPWLAPAGNVQAAAGEKAPAVLKRVPTGRAYRDGRTPAAGIPLPDEVISACTALRHQSRPYRPRHLRFKMHSAKQNNPV